MTLHAYLRQKKLLGELKLQVWPIDLYILSELDIISRSSSLTDYLQINAQILGANFSLSKNWVQICLKFPRYFSTEDHYHKNCYGFNSRTYLIHQLLELRYVIFVQKPLKLWLHHVIFDFSSSKNGKSIWNASKGLFQQV